jgi:hypothetical protein
VTRPQASKLPRQEEEYGVEGILGRQRTSDSSRPSAAVAITHHTSPLLQGFWESRVQNHGDVVTDVQTYYVQTRKGQTVVDAIGLLPMTLPLICWHVGC